LNSSAGAIERQVPPYTIATEKGPVRHGPRCGSVSSCRRRRAGARRPGQRAGGLRTEAGDASRRPMAPSDADLGEGRPAALAGSSSVQKHNPQGPRFCCGCPRPEPAFPCPQLSYFGRHMLKASFSLFYPGCVKTHTSPKCINAVLTHCIDLSVRSTI
jgi:hypothetical protein